MAKGSDVLRSVALNGGTYQWQLPRVTAGPAEGGRPRVPAGEGPDPTTGSTMYTVRAGAGATVTDIDRVKIRWISQSWDGQHVGHDSWQSAAAGESIPTGYLGARVQLAATRGHVGDVYEFVAPATSDAAVAGQSAIVAVEVVAA